MPPRVKRALAVVTAAIGADEIVLVLALALLAVGGWQAWRPGAFLLPGAVLLWITLPARKRFLEAPSVPEAKRTR